MESEKNCILVVVGADAEGNKEIVAINEGFRESKESWKELLQDLKARGLSASPKVAVGDGGLGFWGAATEVFPDTEPQRCWVHKTANILDKLPKSQQPKAKRMIHDIYLAATKSDALKSWKKFVDCYDAKYPKATTCLLKDKESLLTFYNFPAEHWVSFTNDQSNRIHFCYSKTSH